MNDYYPRQYSSVWKPLVVTILLLALGVAFFSFYDKENQKVFSLKPTPKKESVRPPPPKNQMEDGAVFQNTTPVKIESAQKAEF
jgi:hypothetical protein